MNPLTAGDIHSCRLALRQQRGDNPVQLLTPCSTLAAVVALVGAVKRLSIVLGSISHRSTSI